MGLFDRFGAGKKHEQEQAQISAEERKQKEREELIETQRQAHSGLVWPGILPLNLMKMKDDQTGNAIEDPLTPQRKEEVGGLIYEPVITSQDVSELNLQELLFLHAAHMAFNRASALENYESNHRVVYNDLLRRIHEAAEYYVLYDDATKYPLLDGGFAQIYLDKEHAQTAARMYAGQFRKAIVLPRPGETAPPDAQGRKQIPFFDYLYYLGIENVMIDNGWYKAVVHRSEISAPPTFAADPSKNPPASPALAFAMCDFVGEMRWPVKYEKREEIVKKKAERMNALIPKSKYVIPMAAVQRAETQDSAKTENTADANGLDGSTGSSSSKNPVEIRLAMIEMKSADQKSSKRFLPVFTDLFEYARAFPKSEFKPALFEYDKVMSFLGNYDGFIINPKGQSIIVAAKKSNSITS